MAPGEAVSGADAVLRSVGLDLDAAADGSLRLNGKSIRVTSEVPRIISVFDVIAAVNKCTINCARIAWTNLDKKNPEVCILIKACE